MEMVETAPLKGIKLAIASIAICICVFMQVLDYSIANVCIPYISGDLAVSNNIGTWVITSFAVGNAIALPLTGWLASRFGQIRVIVASTALFTFMSWACGFSFNFNMLVVSRFIQGLVAGPLIPLSQSLMLLTYPIKKKNLAMAIWTVVALVGPILGPIAGGWIVLSYKWSWIFYINVPFGILSSIIMWSLLRGYESKIVKTKVDYIGLLLLAVAVTCLQILLDKGEQLDWWRSPVIRSLAVASAISFIYLVIWELKEKNPIIDLSLFKDRNFTLGTAMTAISYMMLFGIIVLTPLWLQTSMGYIAYWSGLAVSQMGIIPVLSMPIVAKLLDRMSARNLVAFSFLGYGIPVYIFTLFTPQVSFKVISLSRLLFGIGITTWLPALTVLAFARIPRDKISSGMGLFHFFRILFGGIGTSLFVTLWEHRITHHKSYLVDTITPYSQRYHFAKEAFQGAAFQGKQALKLIDNSIMKQAAILGVNDCFYLCFLGFVVLFFLSFLFKKRPKIEKRSSK